MAQEVEVNHPSPVVFERSGEVKTTSRDVAELFGKRHDNVLRDIAALIEAGAGNQGGLLTFEDTPYVEPSNGQTYRQYEMTRDGFTLLAMGFTGAKALKFKLAYIEAFNRMEQSLRTRPAIDLNNPADLRMLLANYANDKIELQSQVADLTPKAQALDMISASNGAVTLTQASKVLGMKRADLTKWMHANRWIYRQNGSWVAYKNHIDMRHLEYKEHTYSDQMTGFDCRKPYCHVTPKGLTKLAAIFGSVAQLAA